MYPAPIRQKNELSVDGLINYSHSLRTHRQKVKHNHEKHYMQVLFQIAFKIVQILKVLIIILYCQNYIKGYL